jgi:MFS family permease
LFFILHLFGDVPDPRRAPAALGFITLFFGVGQAIGPSVAGAMADASGTFVSAYLLAGFVALLGAVGALSLRPASTIETVAPSLDHGLQK